MSVREELLIDISRGVASIADFTRAYERSFEGFKKQSAEAGRSIQEVSRNTKDAASSLRGIASTSSAAAAGISRISTSSAAAAGSLQRVERQLQRLAVGFAVYLGGRAVREGLRATVGGFIEVESAMAGVFKTFRGSPAEFAVIEQELHKLSLRIPETVTDLARIGELGSQLDVPKEKLLEFVETVARVQSSTNLTVDEASLKFAQFAGVMQNEAGPQFSRTAAALVHLGNTSKLLEDKLVDLAGRIAVAGHQVRLTEPEVLGFAAAIGSLGVEAEAGGSNFSKFISLMQVAVATGGNQLRLFAETARTTSEEFARTFRERPREAILQFLGGLNALGEQAIPRLLALRLSTNQMRPVILGLAGNMDALRTSLDGASQAFDENNAHITESDRRYKTLEKQIVLAKTQLFQAGLVIGEQLVPHVQDLLRYVKQLHDDGDLVEIGREIGAFASSAASAFVDLVKLVIEYREELKTLGLVIGTVFAVGRIHAWGAAVVAALGQIGAARAAGSVGLAGVGVAGVGAAAVGTGVLLAIESERQQQSRLADSIVTTTNAIRDQEGGWRDYIAAIRALRDIQERQHPELVPFREGEAESLERFIQHYGTLENAVRDFTQRGLVEHAAALQRIIDLRRELASTGPDDLAAFTIGDFRARLGGASPVVPGPGVPGNSTPSKEELRAAEQAAKRLENVRDRILKSAGSISARDAAEEIRGYEHALAQLASQGTKAGPVIDGLTRDLSEFARSAERAGIDVSSKLTPALAALLDGRYAAEFKEFVKDLSEVKIDLNLAPQTAMLAELRDELLLSEASIRALRARGDAFSEVLLEIGQRADSADLIEQLGPELVKWMVAARRAGVAIPPIIAEAAANAYKLAEGTKKSAEETAKLDRLWQGVGQSIGSSVGGLLSGQIGVEDFFGGLGRDVGGQLGGHLGSELGTAAATAIGGTLGGVIGSALPGIGTALGTVAGGMVGDFLGGLFGGESIEEAVAKDVRNNLGAGISEGTAQAIADLDRQLGSGVRLRLTEALGLGHIIRDVGVTRENFADFAFEALLALETVERGIGDTTVANEALNDSWGALIAGAEEIGATGSQAFIQLMQAANAAGVEIEAVTEFQLRRLKDAFLGLSAQGADALESLGLTSAAIVDGIVATAGSAQEALDLLGDEAIDKLVKQYEESGTPLPDSLGHLVDIRNFIKENEELVDAIAGVDDIIRGLSESGRLTLPVFGELSARVNTLNADLLAAGRSQTDALEFMQPALQELVNASIAYGFTIDENTQALIDEASALGLVNEEGTSLIATLQSGFEDLIDTLIQGFEGLGVKMEGLGERASRGARQASDAWGKFFREAGDFSGVPPLPGGSGPRVKLPKAHEGLDMVPSERPYMLKAGEAVLEGREAAAFRAGIERGVVPGNTFNVSINVSGSATEEDGRRVGRGFLRELQEALDGGHVEVPARVVRT